MTANGTSLQVEVLRVDALGAGELDAWRGLRAANAALAHPYFDPRYAAAAAAEAPGARIAVLRRQDEITGFFPFQRRGGLIQPLGAPMTDYHGVIAAPGAAPDLAALVRGVGGGRFRFNGLKGQDGPPGLIRRSRMAARVDAGPAAVEAAWSARDHKFFKNLRRMARALERDHGQPRFVWGERDAGVLDWIIANKRAQYRQTRRHDVFACGWTERLLKRLLDCPDPDFGLRTSWLEVNGEIIAAEAGLVGDGVCHLWFPSYADSFRRYGPGMLLTARELLAAAGSGLTWVDFGCGDEGYKTTFADPVERVFEGVVAGAPLGAAARQVSRALLERAPPLRRLGLSIGRRVDVINACETRATAWLGGAADAVRAAVARPIA